jgi:diguanylate cyclase (GGDEF)-like protein
MAKIARNEALDTIREREELAQALLQATAGLAESREPETVLRRTCETLINTSPHIQLSWIALKDAPGSHTAFPACANGPAREYINAVVNGEAALIDDEPVHNCNCDTPMLMEVEAKNERSSWHDVAHALGLRQVACFPFFNSLGELRGALGLYANHSDYFDRVGLEAFTGFAQLCAVCLEQAELHERLERLAHFDELTDLFNRTSMHAVLNREHANAIRNNEPYALVLFDIDRFKVINDNYGHAMGDRVLLEVAQRAQKVLRRSDWLSRWGGEEFLALLPNTDLRDAVALTERLRLAVKADAMEVEKQRFTVTISAGVVCFPGQGEDLKTLFNAADAALYEAKRSGRDRVCGASTAWGGIFSLAGEIEGALNEQRLTAAAQPIVDLATGKIVAEQLLARIVTHQGQVLAAGHFIGAASQLHLAHRIDYCIFQMALERIAQQPRHGEHVFQFINLSADLLRHPEMIDALTEQTRQVCQPLVDAQGINPLVVEITEREFIDIQQAHQILKPLFDLGVGIAIDDFGSGYSSFQYLSELPVDYLKIEGSLVRQVRHNRKVVAIIEGIRDIARDLQVISLAEWVEDEKLSTLMQDIGIHWGQGYYYGEPVMLPPVRTKEDLNSIVGKSMD